MKLKLLAIICLFGLVVAGCPGDNTSSAEDPSGAAATEKRDDTTVGKAERDVRTGAAEAEEQVGSGKTEKDAKKGLDEAKGKLNLK